jgi:hypothetical protein
MLRSIRSRCVTGFIAVLLATPLCAQTIYITPAGTIGPGQFSLPVDIRYAAGGGVWRVDFNMVYDASRFIGHGPSPMSWRCDVREQYIVGSVGDDPATPLADTSICAVRFEGRWNATAGVTRLDFGQVYFSSPQLTGTGSVVDGSMTFGQAPVVEPTYSRPPSSTITLNSASPATRTVDVAVVAGNTRRRLDCSIGGAGLSLSRGSRFALSPVDPAAAIGLYCTRPVVPSVGQLTCIERQAWPTLDTRMLVWSVRCS